jgi:hypothetical protein
MKIDISLVQSLIYNDIMFDFFVISGEIVELSKEGVKSHCIVGRPEAKLPAFCIFEYVYFARADSVLEGLFSFLYFHYFNFVFITIL